MISGIGSVHRDRGARRNPREAARRPAVAARRRRPADVGRRRAARAVRPGAGARNVRLAILDEPFRGLDRDSGDELLVRAREIWRDADAALRDARHRGDARVRARARRRQRAAWSRTAIRRCCAARHGLALRRAARRGARGPHQALVRRALAPVAHAGRRDSRKTTTAHGATLMDDRPTGFAWPVSRLPRRSNSWRATAGWSAVQRARGSAAPSRGRSDTVEGGLEHLSRVIRLRSGSRRKSPTPTSNGHAARRRARP